MGISINPDTRRASARRRQVLAVTTAHLVVGWYTAAVARESMSAAQAAQHVGEVATVCGTVSILKPDGPRHGW